MIDIKLGTIAKDIITGFTGVVFAHSRYLSGCDQICLKPQKLSKDGELRESQWFDIEQIEAVDAKPVKVNMRLTGGPSMRSDIAPTR